MRGSTVEARISASEDDARSCTTVTITLDWTKADQIEMLRPPLHGCFGDDWLTMADNLMVPEEDGYWQIESESITMALLRAAWITAHVEEAGKEQADEVPKASG